MLHRNSQPRFYDETNTYFITTKTKDNFPFFKEDIFCRLFVENLKLCKKLKQFELYAFAIMPEHVHLLIYPIGDYNISQIMFSIKKQFSHDANRVVGINKLYPINPEGGQTFARLQCGGFARLHVDENIINHQKNVNILHYKFYKKYRSHIHLFPQFQWQSSFHDHVIRNQSDFEKHYDYIHWNPEQHKLVKNCEKYPWPSLNPIFEDVIDSS